MLKKIKLYYKLADIFNFKEVQEIKFAFYLEKIINKIEREVILLGIVRPLKILLKSKLAKANIEKYNHIMQQITLKYKNVKYIDIDSLITEKNTIYDSYHLNQIGHLKVFNPIKRCIYE